MSLPARPKGEHRNAQREGTPASPRGGCQAGRRAGLLATGAWALGLVLPGCASLSESDAQDIELGSAASGVLDPNLSRRLNVQTRLRTTSITWVDTRGRVVDSSSRTHVENKYDWTTSVQRSTDLWRVTAAAARPRTAAVLRVRTERVPLVVSLFPAAGSARALDPERGIEVRPASPGATEWLALFELDPARAAYVTLQAQEIERVAYRISVLRAEHFRL